MTWTWFWKLTGGRPMIQRQAGYFRDVVEGRSVDLYEDRLGRIWMANDGPWSWFRVLATNQKKRPTYQDICEAMAKFLESHGVTITADEIWHLSPSGEVAPVIELFYLCMAAGMAEPVPA